MKFVDVGLEGTQCFDRTCVLASFFRLGVKFAVFRMRGSGLQFLWGLLLESQAEEGCVAQTTVGRRWKKNLLHRMLLVVPESESAILWDSGRP